MSNQSVFQSTSEPAKKLDVIKNNAGGNAFALSPELSLCTLVLTGTFNNAFYATAQDQLTQVIEFANKCSPDFIARLAVHARKDAFMKDSPALLLAILASKDINLFRKAFVRVIDSPKMLRNFVQIIRSGVAGRKSFGRAPRTMMQNYLASLTDDQLFRGSMGNKPSMMDIIKMIHPKATTPTRNALYAYLIDKKYNAEDLPELVKQFESFKKDMTKDMPKVPMEMLTALPLEASHWKQLARQASWTQVRMSLNTFERHGVFEDQNIVESLANKLSDPSEVKRIGALPYQCFAAYKNVSNPTLSKALEQTVEHSLSNVPEFKGKVKVLIDVSGSMGDPITGDRAVATKIRCIDVASLMASAILKKNPDTEIIPFDTMAHKVKSDLSLNSVAKNAGILAEYGGGGTDCACAMRDLNTRAVQADIVIMISDNQSLHQFNPSSKIYKGLPAMVPEWNLFKKNNPGCKLVCLDIAPYANTQVKEAKDVLNCSGFSDNVFLVIDNFTRYDNMDLVLNNINATNLD
jgi:60 kDa SS-A/Ro ribonucleoprotein